MPKKIILDVDPGIVDAIVLCLAVFDPTIEIVALTSVGGNVPADVSAKNLQALVEFLDPPRWPRLGIGTQSDSRCLFDYRHVHGIDGLCGAPLPVAELRSPHLAEKIICEAVRSDPENVIIIGLGPLTNIARAVDREPQIAEMIRHIYISGGSFNGQGNITPCAEFNIYADVEAAKTVFRLPCTKTLVPLDVTNPVLLTPSQLDDLPDEQTKLGKLLTSMITPALWTYRECYALEGIHIHDLITYMVATHPDWVTAQYLPVQIETLGYLTRGVTVADKRSIPESPPNMEVITAIKTNKLLRAAFQGLKHSAKMLDGEKDNQ